ncbi:MAG: hypothetical protein II186_04330, partial [Erysipelotrichales bacterium]|nr:hypothetical protein [Erysipelotrichales bacterium]
MNCRVLEATKNDRKTASKKVVKKLKKLLTSFGERDIITKRELRNARNRSLKTDVEYLVNFEKRIEQATNKKGKKGVRDVLSKQSNGEFDPGSG